MDSAEEEDLGAFKNNPNSNPFSRKRIHCWVMIRKGKREFPNDTFFEPTTGNFIFAFRYGI